MEAAIIEVCSSNLEKIHAVTWELLKQETEKDEHLSELSTMIMSGFPESRQYMPSHLDRYWDLKGSLLIVDGVVMFNNRAIIPSSLRSEVLHAGHQGVSAMTERAKVSVYWPGITANINETRANCYDCNRNHHHKLALRLLNPVSQLPHLRQSQLITSNTKASITL